MGKDKQLDEGQLGLRALGLTRADISGKIMEGERVVIPAMVAGTRVEVGRTYGWVPDEPYRRGFVIPLIIEKVDDNGKRVALVGLIGYEGRGETEH